MWEQLKANSDYEIFSTYPYPLRRKGSDKILTETIDRCYPVVSIGKRKCLKHRLIAQQFLNDFDENLVCDHISRNTFDYRIENLRMVSSSENSKNRSASRYGIVYEFVKEIPESAVPFTKYNSYEFINYFFDKPSQNMYYYNGNEYRIMHKNFHSRSWRFRMMTTENKKVDVVLSKLNRMFK